MVLRVGSELGGHFLLVSFHITFLKILINQEGMHTAISTELQCIGTNINGEEEKNSNCDRNDIFNKLSPKRQSLPSTSLYAYNV